MTSFKDICKKFCTKCGTCVGICPTGALSIGKERIIFDKNKCISCCMCYNNCSGIHFNFCTFRKDIFTKENFDERIGNYRDLFLAQSKDKELRDNSSSGGAVTSLLLNALDKKIIDGAIVVGMSKEEPWRYEVKIVKDQESIYNTKGSKYTIVPLNSILKEATKFKGKLAFVGLPCHIHGIRKLQKNNHPAVKNIKIIIGIFCGFNVSIAATKFLIKKSGIHLKDIKSLEYRGGKWPGGFLIKTKDNKKKFLPKYYYDIVDLCFVPKRCLICADYTNEFADVSFGDIWLEELKREPWSAMIVRSTTGEEFIRKNKESITAKELSLEKLIKSHNHNIIHKKVGAFIRMKDYNVKPFYWIKSIKHSKKNKKKIVIESLVFKIAGSRVFRLLIKMIPLSLMGFAAKMRRKIAGKTI